jgi:P4 family phage/plasmid primase-like protien
MTWQLLVKLGDDGEINLKATRATMVHDDHWAARFLAGTLYPGQLHCIPGKYPLWYVWDGRCHRTDDSSQVERLIFGFADLMDTALARCKQALRIETEAGMPNATRDEIDARVTARWDKEWVDKGPGAYAAKLRGTSWVSLLKRLASVCGESMEAMEDRWPWHLNVANGILDLRTGELFPHAPEAMMTYCLDVAWNPAAQCPLFWGMLDRATGGVPGVRDFLADALGYTLGGTNWLQKLFFMNGPPANGKSKILHVLSTLLGPLAAQGDVMLIGRGHNDRNAREEASIRGARLVAISEMSARINVDESQLKRLTGQDVIEIHWHYRERKLRTMVSFVIFGGTNEMPSVLHIDAGIRRRGIVIPMGPSIPEPEWDKHLANKIISSELEGVLALMVAGFQRAMAHEFRDLPPEVLAATEEWVSDQDSIAAWMDQAQDIELAPDGAMMNGQAGSWSAQPSEVWASYDRFHGPAPHLNRTEFLRDLNGRRGVVRSNDRRWFIGIKIRQPTYRSV